MQDARHYIASAWRSGGELGDSLNAADGTALGQFPPRLARTRREGGACCARNFLRKRLAASPRMRTIALFELADRPEAARDEIADLVVAEGGKLRSETLGVTMGAVSEARCYGGCARTIRGNMQETAPVANANATPCGIAASVSSREIGRAMRFSRAIRAGTVWINSHLRLFAEGEAGGYRRSGFGRRHGVKGLDDLLEAKHVSLEAGTCEAPF